MKNILLERVRVLEKKALELSVIDNSDIKSVVDMREEAFECYLVGKMEHLQYMIDNKLMEL